MKNKLCLFLLTAGLALGVTAPAQANSVSPTVLDFGSFAANAVPSTLLSATVTSGGPNSYFAGVEMSAGKAYFFPSSDCGEAQKDFPPCSVRVRMGSELTATGPLTGTITVKFSNDGQHEVPPVTETQTIEVKANITPAISTPPVIPPTTTTPGSTTTPTAAPPAKKKPCPKKAGAKSSAAKGKGKACGKGKSKGKGKGKKGKGGK